MATTHDQYRVLLTREEIEALPVREHVARLDLRLTDKAKAYIKSQEAFRGGAA